MTTLFWTLPSVVPYAILATAGVLLWKRWHSAATAMVALGLAAALVGLVLQLFAAYKLSAGLQNLNSAVDTHRDTLFVVAHYHASSLVTHHAGLFGLSLAAVGLIWHANRDR